MAIVLEMLLEESQTMENLLSFIKDDIREINTKVENGILPHKQYRIRIHTPWGSYQQSKSLDAGLSYDEEGKPSSEIEKFLRGEQDAQWEEYIQGEKEEIYYNGKRTHFENPLDNDILIEYFLSDKQEVPLSRKIKKQLRREKYALTKKPVSKIGAFLNKVKKTLIKLGFDPEKSSSYRIWLIEESTRRPVVEKYGNNRYFWFNWPYQNDLSRGILEYMDRNTINAGEYRVIKTKFFESKEEAAKEVTYWSDPVGNKVIGAIYLKKIKKYNAKERPIRPDEGKLLRDLPKVSIEDFKKILKTVTPDDSRKLIRFTTSNPKNYINKTSVKQIFRTYSKRNLGFLSASENLNNSIIMFDRQTNTFIIVTDSYPSRMHTSPNMW